MKARVWRGRVRLHVTDTMGRHTLAVSKSASLINRDHRRMRLSLRSSDLPSLVCAAHIMTADESDGIIEATDRPGHGTRPRPSRATHRRKGDRPDYAESRGPRRIPDCILRSIAAAAHPARVRTLDPSRGSSSPLSGGHGTRPRPSPEHTYTHPQPAYTVSHRTRIIRCDPIQGPS